MTDQDLKEYIDIKLQILKNEILEETYVKPLIVMNVYCEDFTMENKIRFREDMRGIGLSESYFLLMLPSFERGTTVQMFNHNNLTEQTVKEIEETILKTINHGK